MLTTLFVEASIELVPYSIIHHPAVVRNAKREGKNPESVLLDRSLHHHAMVKLPEAEKRGRPDILHFCLLEALGSPLNKSGGLKLLAQTINGELLDFSPELRLPRDCYRFKSLMEQLFTIGRVPPEPETPLITLTKKSLKKIKAEIKPSRTIALTSHGRGMKLENLCKEMAAEAEPLVFIGAYPHGALRDETLAEADDAVSIHPEALEAWVVTSRLIYEFEKASGFS